MSPDKLVYMANQIATFFRSQPRGDRAALVARHLTDFWDPRMRRALVAHVAEGAEGLDPLVIEAAGHLRERA